MSKTPQQFIARTCESARQWLNRSPKISIHDLSDQGEADKEEVQTYIELTNYAENRILGLEKTYNMLRTCTKGCAHCCYQAIYVSETETRIILNWLRLNNVRFDPPLPIRLEKWNASFNRTELFLLDIQTDEFKEGYFHAHIPCPFLGSDNTCEIYPVRPLCCRHYFSISAPEHCEKSPFVDDAIILRCWDLVVLMKLLLSRESTWLAGPTILENLKAQSNQRVRLLPIALAEDLKTGQFDFFNGE